MIHATYITHMSSEEEAALSIPQLRLEVFCWQQQLECE